MLCINVLSFLIIVVIWNYKSTDTDFAETALKSSRTGQSEQPTKYITSGQRFSQPYDIKHQSFGRLIDDSIDLRIIDNFLTLDECQSLIESADSRYQRSMVQGTIGGTVHAGRTSDTVPMYPSESPLIMPIMNKATQLIAGSLRHLEPLQMVRYQDGQQIHTHYDSWNDTLRNKKKNQRLFTWFVYLNTVKVGGGTHFHHLDRTFYPQAGTAIFWRNMNSTYQPETRSLHSAMVVGDHMTKYGLNIWYNVYPTR